MRPLTRYATSGDVQVAYQVTGEGPIDIVWAPGAISHLDLDWEWPPRARMFEMLGSFARLIRFDKRGTGLSDRPTAVPTLAERTDDIRAVMDAAGSECAALIGMSEGGSMGVHFAVTRPERISKLVIVGCQARWGRAPDYPWGSTDEEHERLIEQVAREWPSKEYLLGAGSGIGRNVDPAFLEWLLRYAQAAVSPGAIIALESMGRGLDIRDLLPRVTVPTLVVGRTGDPVADIEAVRDLAARIPGARLVEYPGETHQVIDILDEFVAEVRAFVTGESAPVPTSRILTTILVVDIAGSTEMAARLGDRDWRGLLERFYAAAGRELASYGGREVDRAGDALLVTIDGPSRAISCARAIVRSSADLGLRVRAGVHAGEVEMADGAVRGLAVHIASRVAALADPGGILVTGTVRDLVTGSGVTLDDRGFSELKGVPDARHLFAVR